MIVSQCNFVGIAVDFSQLNFFHLEIDNESTNEVGPLFVTCHLYIITTGE